MSAPLASPPIARNPIAGFDSSSAPGGDIERFDWFATIIAQYANSPIILQLVANMADYLDPRARFDAFFDTIWNVDRAQSYGLDVWGRIVGVDRVLQVANDTFFGFEEAGDAEPFDQAPFYNGTAATSNFSLSDTAYRKLILAKALANITDGSIPSINQILLNIFPDYGNSYVRDNGDMTLTYVFGAPLSPVDQSIVYQSGVLPRPAGVLALVQEV